MPWPGAEQAPYNNVIGIDPQLMDPENGDFRLEPGSPAQGYGCQTFVIQSGSGTSAVRDDTEAEPDWFEQRTRARSSLDVSGPITTDTVWDVDSVRVQGDIEIADGVTLTIPAGVRVEFQDYYALTVRGRLLALGQPEARVHFTSRDSSAFGVDSSLAGAWAGIRFPFTLETNPPSRLEYCVIEYAKNAGNGERGGALQLNGFSKLTVINTVLRRNVADFGAAIACTHFASPEIIGCLMVENVAFVGGAAVHCLDAYPRLTACTIVANEDRNTNICDPSAAIYAHVSKPWITGSILRDNSSWYFEPTQILYGKHYYTTWSNIGDGWAGEGNIDLDPLFLGSGDHPYGLQDVSPCVNAGPPDTTGLRLPQEDIAGTFRIVGRRVDMGAYEGDPGNARVGDIIHMPNPRIELQLPYPNPFESSTTICFWLASAQHARLAVYDVTGSEVSLLADGFMAVGPHEISWAGRDRYGRKLPSGLYLLRLRAGTSEVTQKLINHRAR